MLLISQDKMVKKELKKLKNKGILESKENPIASLLGKSYTL